MIYIGYDIGSSAVKAAIFDADKGITISEAQSPETEMAINSPESGWAEQEPETWWQHLVTATQKALTAVDIDKSRIWGIGISYQMHGLVLINEHKEVLRPAIIWCDSRAVTTGEKAFAALGSDYCTRYLLNSPGNFTASKLKWVKDNTPEIYGDGYAMLLPGDFINMKLTGEINTTISALSEGIFWDFSRNKLSSELMGLFDFKQELIPPLVACFGTQGIVNAKVAHELGIPEGIPVAYRAGDQPNNAFSLNVLNPGETAATAGTSGVIYTVSEKPFIDESFRFNSFAHVNYEIRNPRIGSLLCLNGAGILNSRTKKYLAQNRLSYSQINDLAAEIPPGSEGIRVLPFGNGAERILNNRNIGAHFLNTDFNRHTDKHVFRAVQEGIVFALYYGMNIMKDCGIKPGIIRAGNANMFLSPAFKTTLASLSGLPVEIFNTNGATGAARGAALGTGFFKTEKEAFESLKCIEQVQPDKETGEQLHSCYDDWCRLLNSIMQNK